MLLLSNISGLPDLLTRRFKDEPGLRASTASAASIVQRFGGNDVQFEPGRGWDYAALNWAIVQAIMERLSGEPLPDLIARLALDLLGITRTGIVQAGQPRCRSSRPPMPARPRPSARWRGGPPFLTASGNAASTIADVVRAAHGVSHTSLLRPTSRTALTTIRWPDEEHALGGRVHPIDGDPWSCETGKVQGYRAHIAHRLRRSETIVVFNNTDLAQSAIAEWVEAIARA